MARAGLSWQPRFRARGFVQPVVPKAATPQVTKADSLNELGVRLHFLEVKANKIYRRLNAVAKMQIFGPQLIETWANARRALWWFAARAQDFSVCFPEMLPSADEIKEIRTWLQSTVQSCMKSSMPQLAKSGLNDSLGTNASGLFRNSSPPTDLC